MTGVTITEAEGKHDVLYVEKDGATVTVYEDGDILEGRTEFGDGKLFEWSFND